MDDTLNTIGEDLKNLIVGEAEDLGLELVRSGQEVAEYAAVRADHLATVIGEPGFRKAAIAERDSLLLYSLGKAVDKGDSVDARLQGLVQGALAMGARAIRLLT